MRQVNQISINKGDIPADGKMTVTVIVCTCSRVESLASTLESLAASQATRSITWEVFVVDNNSAGRTRQVAEDLCRRHPDRFRYLSEPRPGKSYALNRGVANARAEILTSIDGDAPVEPSWLENLTAEFWGSDWAGVAERTLSAQPFTPPSWLDWKDCVLWQLGGGFRYDPLSIVFSHFDLGTGCPSVRRQYGCRLANPEVTQAAALW
jgi:glycosyltransferase involved in cell wall biosynthesis